MKFRIAAAASLLLALPTLGIAQEAADPPLIRDIPEKQTLPADGVFDILGLRLGMTRQEAMARLKQIAPDAEIKPHNAVVQLRDPRGNAIRFRYAAKIEVNYKTAEGVREQMFLFFTTLHSGDRISNVTRSLHYNEDRMGSITDLMAGLNEKYGPPSYETPGGRAIKNVHYIWYNGQRQRFTKQTMDAQFSRPGTAANCVGALGSTYSHNRRDDYPGCTTHMKIVMFPGKRDDLASQVQFYLYDRKRMFENIKDADAWVNAEIERVSKSQTGSRPKL